MKTALILVTAGVLLLGYALVSLDHVIDKTVATQTKVIDSVVNVDNILYKTPVEFPTENVVRKQKKVTNLILSQNDTVFLLGEVGSDAISTAQEITQKSLHNKIVYLVINSPGGSVLDGALIVSAIQASRVPVVTICSQLCASMAAIIFESGAKRLMVDRAVLMFHDAAGGVQGTFPQIKDRFDFFSSYVNKMDNEIAHRAGIPLSQFMAKLNPECWRDAEDSLNEHFSDGYANLVFSGTTASEGPSMSQTKNLKSKFEVQLGN